MNVDLEVMSQIVAECSEKTIVGEFGERGGEAWRMLLRALREIYIHVAPEQCSSRMCVFRMMGNETVAFPAGHTDVVSADYLAVHSSRLAAVQVLENGGFRVWTRSLEPSFPEEVSSCAVVYLYEDGNECVIVKGRRKPIRNPYPAYPSVFALPTFSRLHDALESYAIDVVRQSDCAILEGIWYDPDRVFLKNAPEATVRKSLSQYLRHTFRGNAEVRPEQPVDESHPIDIKVTWMLANRLALIEIKWLGTPRYPDGHLGSPYLDSRARRGAKQLADYLDSNARLTARRITRGYLVVIDARRAGLNDKTVSVNMDDGFHYRDSEIVYRPEYDRAREDFERPIRMFAEPRCR